MALPYLKRQGTISKALMNEFYDDEFYNADPEDEVEEHSPDPREIEARADLRRLFEEDRERVVFSRQLEVQFEHKYFHWITNRAIRNLAFGEGLLRAETRSLPRAGSVTFYWHKRFRYYKREANRIAQIIDEYANPENSAAIGRYAELLVLEAFAKKEFVYKGKDVRAFNGLTWIETNHDLDYIFTRDSITYGIEVKNMLGYMDQKELRVKIRLCQHLNIRPVFVVRMIPKSWMNELYEEGGFGLIYKAQLYPWTDKARVEHIARELGLPIIAPKSIEEGTMARFLRWHQKLCESQK